MGEIADQPGNTPSGSLCPCPWPAVSPVLICLVEVGLATLPLKTISYCHDQIKEQRPGLRLWLWARPWLQPWPGFLLGGQSTQRPLWCQGIRGSWWTEWRVQGKAHRTPAIWMVWEDPLTLLLILGVTEGLQKRCLLTEPAWCKSPADSTCGLLQHTKPLRGHQWLIDCMFLVFA